MACQGKEDARDAFGAGERSPRGVHQSATVAAEGDGRVQQFQESQPRSNARATGGEVALFSAAASHGRDATNL